MGRIEDKSNAIEIERRVVAVNKKRSRKHRVFYRITNMLAEKQQKRLQTHLSGVLFCLGMKAPFFAKKKADINCEIAE